MCSCFHMLSYVFLLNREFPINPFWGHPGCEVPHVSLEISFSTDLRVLESGKRCGRPAGFMSTTPGTCRSSCCQVLTKNETTTTRRDRSYECERQWPALGPPWGEAGGALAPMWVPSANANRVYVSVYAMYTCKYCWN